MHGQVFGLRAGRRSQERSDLGRRRLKTGNGQYRREKGRAAAPQEKDANVPPGTGRVPLCIRPNPAPTATHQTGLVVLGHLTDELVQLQAAGADDLDPEVVGMLGGRDVDLQGLVGVETEVRAGD